ncbi:hypothetical protein Q4551_13555 [Oceanobacter sp. 5_MG-2023]|uniref:hypothetical protein n=1 Tax=Oceanobacter sp. 5_MG-2023 TaxID=3062645 RepID=UPI0026E29358|nr:hypothetical protein [Oceanobacter sp. 5_MG-2023]MDO6683314.1 hypothetical protein [Oceanobacter sp. 5_MG-2023]
MTGSKPSLITTSLTTLALSISLIGCGSDDDSDSNPNTEYQVSPLLSDTSVTLTEGSDSLSINQYVEGNLSSTDETDLYTYTAAADGWVMILLDGSTDSNLDLLVYADDELIDNSSYITSTEAILIDVSANSDYVIEIEAIITGSYTLTVAEPSRALMSLDDNDYLALSSSNYTLTCDSGTSDGSYSDLFIINFDEATMRWPGSDSHSMSLDGDSVTIAIDEEYQQTINGIVYLYDSDGNLDAELERNDDNAIVSATYSMEDDTVITIGGNNDSCHRTESGTFSFML